jgi:hypothetical protein
LKGGQGPKGCRAIDKELESMWGKEGTSNFTAVFPAFNWKEGIEENYHKCRSG